VDDDDEGEEGAAPFASTREDLSQLLGGTRRFASGETEQLTGLLLASLETRVDVAENPCGNSRSGVTTRA
jgi:hypothetical protein